MREAFVRALRMGNYLETAAAFAGLSKVTVYEWLKRGAREEEGEHREFLNAVEKAQATAEARDLAIIASAASRQWQAAAWRLERMHSDRFGQRSRVDQKVSGANGEAITIEIRKLPEQEEEPKDAERE